MISYIGANKHHRQHRRNKTDLGFHLLVEGVSVQNFGFYMFSKIFGFYMHLNRTVSRSWLRSFHGFLPTMGSFILKWFIMWNNGLVYILWFNLFLFAMLVPSDRSHHLLRPHGTMQGKARRAVVPFIINITIEINFSSKVYSKSLQKVGSFNRLIAYSLILFYQFCACVMRTSGIPQLQVIRMECLYGYK